MTKDVLPTIRKTGSYSLPGKGEEKPVNVQLSPIAMQLAVEMQQASEAMASALSNGGRKDFYDYLMLTMQPASFYTMATDYGWTVATLLTQLQRVGIIRIDRRRDRGEEYSLNPIHEQHGYLQARSETERVTIGITQEPVFTAQCEWTPKGRVFVYGQFRMAGILPVLERNLMFLTQTKK